jgi:hypothetical protein
MATETLPEHSERCPDCGCEDDRPNVHREDCPRLGSVLQFGPPWLLFPQRLAGRGQQRER